MTIPPDVAFHRYFQRMLSRPARALYRGKVDLSLLHPEDARVLTDVQDLVNTTLRQVGDRYHFDYIDSDVRQAMAFLYDGYRFIGATIPLVRDLLAISNRLGASDSVVSALRLPGSEVNRDSLAGIMARIQLSFVAAHEFTHHDHGHVPDETAEGAELDEYGPEASCGMPRQVWEIAADGYAVYLLLDNLVDGADRAGALEGLAMEPTTMESQDRALTAALVTAVGAQFLSFSPRNIRADEVRSLTHPPPAARMHFVMQHVSAWAAQSRQHLRAWMTPSEFQTLMQAAAAVIWGSAADPTWAAQVAFLSSSDGARYLADLTQALYDYKAALP